jgi:hypothetical protein
MANDLIPTPTVDERLVAFGRQLQQLEVSIRDPELAAALGAGIVRELSGAMATFRQRCPGAVPGSQSPLPLE